MNSSPDKRSLRSLAMKQRQALSPQLASEATTQILHYLQDLEALLAAANIALYMPVKGEVDITPLCATLTKLGKACLLPVPEAGDPMLCFFPWKPGDGLEKGAFDIPIPTSRIQQATPDLLLLPVVAFDSEGYRLGYGAGYYDRLLKTLRAQAPTTAIGIAYAIQEVEKIPVEPHDEKLDMVVTETGIRMFKK